MEERYIAAVDIGTGKIGLAIAGISGRNIDLMWYREMPSSGVRNSLIFNAEQAKEAVRPLIAAAQQELGMSIEQVVVGLPKFEVRQVDSRGNMDRTDPDESISRDEIEFLKSAARNNYPLEDRDREEVYGAVAQSFSTDEEINLVEKDTIGAMGAFLEGNFKLFIGKKSAIKNIDKVFNKLGIAIDSKFFAPDSQARAILPDAKMENGVALIDFGAGSTSVSIYKGGILRHYASIPFGGNAVTGDIRIECGITEQLAENIKKGFGICMPDKLQNMADKIIEIRGGDNTCKQISVHYLSEIITCRMTEIIEAVLYEIQQSGYADELRSGVVITGGGAKMGNLALLIKDLSGYSVSMGLPRNIFQMTGCHGAMSTSATVALGMLVSARDNTHLNCLHENDLGPEIEVVTSEEEPEGETATEDAETPVEEVKEEPAKPEQPANDKPGSSIRVKWTEKVGNFFKKMYNDSPSELGGRKGYDDDDLV